MQNIIFTKINRNDFSSMKKIINLFKEWKDIQFDDPIEIEDEDFENKTIEDALEIIDIVGERYNTKFWHPSADELEEYFKDYTKLSLEEKINKGKSHPWDFDSWIDAILNSEIMIYDLIEEGNNYKITLEQLAYPSGGIEAMENLIKIYDGEIIKNDMI